MDFMLRFFCCWNYNNKRLLVNEKKDYFKLKLSIFEPRNVNRGFS